MTNARGVVFLGAVHAYLFDRYATGMTLQELVDEIDKQPAWQQQGTRAPHKPLAILFALGRALAKKRLTRFSEAEAQLIALLEQFGPPRESPKPAEPIWRMRRYRSRPTRFWELNGAIPPELLDQDNPPIGPIRQHVSFGLSEEAAKLICENPANAYALAAALADKIAPPTLQEELLEAVGVGPRGSPIAALGIAAAAADPVLIGRAMRTVSTLVRDPAFSRRVRKAYNYSCAICSISPRLEGKVFGLEAAHIRWANAGGPDELSNGVCLCRMHHHALDKGAIKIDRDMRVQLSPKLAKSPECDKLFASFSGEAIRLPSKTADHPHPTMLAWHWREVFKG